MENRRQFLRITDGESPFEAYQVDRLLKALVFRSKHHRTAEGDRLLNIMNVHPETTAYVDEACILIQLREDADGIND